MRSPFSLILVSVVLCLIAACKKANLAVEGKTLIYYEKEDDYDSHIGELRFQNGKIDSVQPEGEGQIITLGTYETSQGGLSMKYHVISTYSTPTCQDIDGSAKREACLEAAKAEKYPLWENSCQLVESKENLFYFRFFLCNNKGLLASSEHAVSVSEIRRFQGIKVQREAYQGKINKPGCLVYTQISPTSVRSDLFEKSAAIGLETMVLGTAKTQSAVHGTSDWLIAFFNIEPIFPSPVWVKAECVARL